MTDYQGLKVAELKDLLRERGLRLSGNKNELIARLQRDDWGSDNAYFETAQPYTHDWGNNDQHGLMPSNYDNFDPVYDSIPTFRSNFDHFPMAAQYSAPVAHGMAAASRPDPTPENLRKAFDKILENEIFWRLKEIIVSVASVSSRSSISCTFPAISKERGGTKILLYCYRLQNDISNPKHIWPKGCTVVVNRQTVPVIQQSNDGSHVSAAVLERPCDITHRVCEHASNSCTVSSVLLTPSIPWGIRVARMENVTTEELLQKIGYLERRKSLQTIRYVFGDGEVVCDEMLVDLRCPVSLTRVLRPCKGSFCDHVQCFDAARFLDYQRKAKNANWKCFICQKVLTLKDLVFDEWFMEVLHNVQDPNIHKVQYFIDGTYKIREEDDDGSSDSDGEGNGPPRKKLHTEKEASSSTSQFISLISDDEDDDDVEVQAVEPRNSPTISSDDFTNAAALIEQAILPSETLSHIDFLLQADEASMMDSVSSQATSEAVNERGMLPNNSVSNVSHEEARSIEANEPIVSNGQPGAILNEIPGLSEEQAMEAGEHPNSSESGIERLYGELSRGLNGNAMQDDSYMLQSTEATNSNENTATPTDSSQFEEPINSHESENTALPTTSSAPPTEPTNNGEFNENTTTSTISSSSIRMEMPEMETNDSMTVNTTSVSPNLTLLATESIDTESNENTAPISTTSSENISTPEDDTMTSDRPSLMEDIDPPTVSL